MNLNEKTNELNEQVEVNPGIDLERMQDLLERLKNTDTSNDKITEEERREYNNHIDKEIEKVKSNPSLDPIKKARELKVLNELRKGE